MRTLREDRILAVGIAFAQIVVFASAVGQLGMIRQGIDILHLLDETVEQIRLGHMLSHGGTNRDDVVAGVEAEEVKDEKFAKKFSRTLAAYLLPML